MGKKLKHLEKKLKLSSFKTQRTGIVTNYTRYHKCVKKAWFKCWSEINGLCILNQPQPAQPTGPLTAKITPAAPSGMGPMSMGPMGMGPMGAGGGAQMGPMPGLTSGEGGNFHLGPGGQWTGEGGDNGKHQPGMRRHSGFFQPIRHLSGRTQKSLLWKQVE